MKVPLRLLPVLAFIACPAADQNAPSDTTDAADADTIDTTPEPRIVAVPGQRCELADRIGLITIEDVDGIVYLRGSVDDRPNPWFGAPELSTASCDFHRFSPTGACPPCSGIEICGVDGTCSPSPIPHADLVVNVGDQTFTPGVTGDINAKVTGAPPFAFDLTFSDRHISLAETAWPSGLSDLTGTLDGVDSAPTRVKVTWSTNDVGTHVFTRISINHHASGPTFTECTVPASSGSLSVSEDMLKPLAVSTGLEFQGVEHVRFAAAQTSDGCVELRVIRRHHLRLL